MFGFLETFDIAETLTLILLCCFCCFLKCFEEDEESCLPKRDEVLVGIENMIGGFKLVCVCVCVYIYISARFCSSLIGEEKKIALCVSRSALFSAVKTFSCRFF